ncbi:MAG: hypothetical protein KA319_13110 [Ferruginibacter sp.]|nr:hypothetical protein [Ferruginibacter sp.]
MVTHLSFVKKAGLSNTWIVSLFTIKLLAGVAVGYCSLHFYGIHNDYWDNNYHSVQEFEVLKTNPKYFFSELFISNYNGSYADFWGHADSFWNDLKNNCLIKFMAFFNVISRGNYYINSVFFNSIVFLGHIALYRLFKKMFPSFNYGLIIGCFLLPSFLYFSSGIHRDGLLFTLITISLYCAYSIFQEGKQNFKYYIAGLLSVLLLLILRNIVAITLLPLLAAWWLSTKVNYKPAYVVLVVLSIFILAILFAGKISSINPLQFIADKQADYFGLEAGNTQTMLQVLQPTAISFLYNTPTALSNVLIKPFIWQKPIMLLPFALEVLAYFALIIIFFYKTRKQQLAVPTIFWAVILGFLFLSFLFIGHIIPNLGAIIRYRSIYLPFIITPIIASILTKDINIKK